MIPNDRLLPAGPSKLVTKHTSSRNHDSAAPLVNSAARAATLFGRIAPPAHVAKMQWILSRTKQFNDLSPQDARGVINSAL